MLNLMILVGIVAFLISKALRVLGRRKPAGPRPAPFLLSRFYVIDGDTLAHGKSRIRLSGIDAPELAQAGGQAARQELIELLRGQTLTVLPIETDRYGRLIAKVEVGGFDLGGMLVERGYARADRAARAYHALEKRARKGRRGLWATREGIADPAAFRRSAA